MTTNIVEEYVDEIAKIYVEMYPETEYAIAKRLAAEIISESLIDIPCTLHNDTYHEYVDTSVLDVLNWLDQRKPIITGNGTFFKQHEEYLAPSIRVLETWLSKRKKIKKEMFKYPKGSIEYNNKNTGQLNQKVICNADYGEGGSPLSSSYSIYIPPATTGSAKNLTTSLLCILELFITNNDEYILLKDINELFDFIRNVLNDDREKHNEVTFNFDPETVAKRLYNMMRRKTKNDYYLLYNYMCTLDTTSRSKLMFAFNIRLLLTNILYGEANQLGTYFTHHMIALNDCTKESLQLAGFGETAPEAVSDLFEHVANVIVDTCVYPFIPNDVEFRADNAKRRIVGVVDTDSLMLHFAALINEFQVDTGNFKLSCICGSAFGTRLFANYIVPQFVDYYARRCGIKDPYYRAKFSFKNEFTFAVMILFQKKMYLSSMFVQEGNPRDIHEIDAKGVSFKKRDTADFLEPVILQICDECIMSSDDINVHEVIERYKRLHNEIKHKVIHDISCYKKSSLKDKDAYDQTKELPMQMRGAIIWNEISDEQMQPMDRVYVVPLSFDLLSKSNNIRTMKLYNLCKVHCRKEACICLPETYKTIPDWIAEGIDAEYNTDKLLAPFKQILQGLNVYLPDTAGSFKCTNMLYL